jgi:hypothetical protein
MALEKFKKNKGNEFEWTLQVMVGVMAKGSLFLQVRGRGIRFHSCWIASVGIWLPTFRDN